MYDIKALYEAASVDDAIALLTAHPEAKIIAGGSRFYEGKLGGNWRGIVHVVAAAVRCSIAATRTGSFFSYRISANSHLLGDNGELTFGYFLQFLQAGG